MKNKFDELFLHKVQLKCIKMSKKAVINDQEIGHLCVNLNFGTVCHWLKRDFTKKEKK